MENGDEWMKDMGRDADFKIYSFLKNVPKKRGWNCFSDQCNGWRRHFGGTNKKKGTTNVMLSTCLDVTRDFPPFFEFFTKKVPLKMGWKCVYAMHAPFFNWTKLFIQSFFNHSHPILAEWYSNLMLNFPIKFIQNLFEIYFKKFQTFSTNILHVKC